MDSSTSRFAKEGFQLEFTDFVKILLQSQLLELEDLLHQTQWPH